MKEACLMSDLEGEVAAQMQGVSAPNTFGEARMGDGELL